MISGEQRRLVVGEAEKEDGEKADEEGGEARVVDEIEQTDLGPRRRSSRQDGASLTVVKQFATHGFWLRRERHWITRLHA